MQQRYELKQGLGTGRLPGTPDRGQATARRKTNIQSKAHADATETADPTDKNPSDPLFPSNLRRRLDAWRLTVE